MVRVKLANLITEIYANGAELLVEGSMLGIKGNPPQRIYNEVEEHKRELLEALTGDPLSGEGWQIRLALAKQADTWLFEMIPEEAEERVTRALERNSTIDPFSEVWANGTFEEFRAALKEYIRTGLMAAKGTAKGTAEVSF